MIERPRRIVRPSTLTWIVIGATLATIAGTLAFVVAAYPSLPDILPVRFNARGRPIGWQYKTYVRVVMPVLVQVSLTGVFGAVAALILSRSHQPDAETAPDIAAASTTAEAIALVAFVWVAFQAYAAAALILMWHRGREGLGGWYSWLTWAGAAVSLAIALRANSRLGKPAPREFVSEHWKFGYLYRNPGDPALFVPTRDGGRWTLNFGRPVAAALLGIVLLIGIVAPTVILGLLLRF